MSEQPPPSRPTYPAYPGDDGFAPAPAPAPGTPWTRHPANHLPGPGNRPSPALAVVALVCAVLAPLVITLVVAVILAVIVLALQRDGRVGGRRMAIAALIVSLLWTALFVLGAVVVLVDERTPGPEAPSTSGASPSPGIVTYDELAVGDCLLDSVADLDVVEVVPRPCSQSHTLEVYDEFTLPAGTYPGDEKVSADAEAGCVDRFEAFVGATYQDSELVVEFIRPLEQAWRTDRGVTCLIGTDGRSFGTLKDAEQ